MKIANGILAVALAFTLPVLNGCTSPGYRKSEAAAASLDRAAAEVHDESVALDLTMGTLRDLGSQPQPNLKLCYAHFSRSLDSFKKHARRTEATGEVMVRRTADYFEAWDRQLDEMSYEAVRNRSSARRTEAVARFNAVNQRYRETQTVVEPLIGYLDDIRRALGTDLTVGGVRALKPVIDNAETNAAKVQRALSGLADQLSSASRELSAEAVQTSGQ